MKKEENIRQGKKHQSRRQKPSEADCRPGAFWSSHNRTRRVSWGITLVLLVLMSLGSSQATAGELKPPTNYFYEAGAFLDIADPLLDDKGPGYYQYPLDRSISRGMYDLKRFTVYEEGKVLTFVIQMREYINTDTRSSKYGADQGFVGQTFDIYIDMDRKPQSGYKKALPARQVRFAGDRGWEKMILVTPLSHYRVYDLMKNKTDDLEFQNWIPDIILPDYVQIQRDKLIIRINKDFLGKGNPADWGFQMFVMGFSPVVSTNQMLNMDVRAFAAKNAFGGGWDTHGDPPIMDCIVPEGEDQYALLREYKSEPFHGEIESAVLPFVCGNDKKEDEVPVKKKAVSKGWVPPALALPAEEKRGAPSISAPRPVARPEFLPPNIEFSGSEDSAFPPIVKSVADLGLPVRVKKDLPKNESAFIPIKPSGLAKPAKKPVAKKDSGFIALKK